MWLHKFNHMNLTGQLLHWAVVTLNSLVSNCTTGNHFADFVNDAYKMAGAISFRKPHAGVSKTSLWHPGLNCHIQVLPTVFLDTGFDFEDGVEGNYILGRPPSWFDSDRRGIVFDWDGTITGRPLATVIRWYGNGGLLSLVLTTG